MRQWTGLCDMTPDSSPILGATEVERFWLMAGMGTWGFKGSPIFGTTMAELIATGRTPELIAPFAATGSDRTGWCPTPPPPARTDLRGLGGLAGSRRVGGLALGGIRGSAGLARFALEDAEDRLHLGVAQGRVAPGALGRREQRPQVRLGHLGASLELLHLDRELLRAAIGLLTSLPRLPRLLARRPQRAS